MAIKLTFRDLNAVASGLGAWVGVIKKTTSENFTYVDESPVTYLPFDEDNVRLAPRYSGTAQNQAAACKTDYLASDTL